MPFDVIPVKTVYDEFQNDGIKMNAIPAVTLETEQKENASNRDEEIIADGVRDSNNLTFFNDNLTNDDLRETDKIEKSRNSRFFHSIPKLVTTEVLDFRPKLNENIKTIQDIKDEEEISPLLTTVVDESTRSTTIDDATTTQSIYESEERGKEDSTQVYNISVDSDTTFTSTEFKVTTPSNDVTDKTTDEESKSTSNFSNMDLQIPTEKDFQNISDSDESKDIQTVKSVTETLLPEDKVTVAAHTEDLLTSATETISQNSSFFEVSSITKINDENLKNMTSMTSITPPELTDVKSNIRKANNKEQIDNNENILRAKDRLDISEINENASVQNIDDSFNKKVYEVYEVVQVRQGSN
ncbi:myb-like protein X [Bicyclus anynana]|uniref:Myb-like protein X n=1 Tax=Bicyclus anynana TaxID=110368 RepID=A0ABM3LV72_BICAN|nr:myb-like protein X [Bicyclus anynana]